ncbi:hypothetical protein CEXT_510181 [Caerostris extrusa]|uniref:Uncharacterized protein n=1 Tax=Caerostris extrusa TaxID=172846 RepID=A0AAV4QRS0_CAEEX|nr:hypothetical protein CEXT_510181 [Caerostris extrusa]
MKGFQVVYFFKKKNKSVKAKQQNEQAINSFSKNHEQPLFENLEFERRNPRITLLSPLQIALALTSRRDCIEEKSIARLNVADIHTDDRATLPIRSA